MEDIAWLTHNKERWIIYVDGTDNDFQRTVSLTMADKTGNIPSKKLQALCQIV